MKSWKQLLLPWAVQTFRIPEVFFSLWNCFVVKSFVNGPRRQIEYNSLTSGTVEMKSLCVYVFCSWAMVIVVCHLEAEGHPRVIGPFSPETVQLSGAALSAPNRTFITNTTLIPATPTQRFHISRCCTQTWKDKHRYKTNAYMHVWMRNVDCGPLKNVRKLQKYPEISMILQVWNYIMVAVY